MPHHVFLALLLLLIGMFVAGVAIGGPNTKTLGSALLWLSAARCASYWLWADQRVSQITPSPLIKVLAVVPIANIIALGSYLWRSRPRQRGVALYGLSCFVAIAFAANCWGWYLGKHVLA